MKNRTFAGLAIRIAVFYFTLAGVSQSIQAQSEIRFRLVHNTLIVVSLTAGGEGPFDFILDTGADTTIVDQSIAPRLSLIPMDRVQQTTLAGVQTLTRGSIPTLSIGSAQAENVAVLVEDLAELRKLNPHIQGIAGQNFLSHFNYLLDYHKHVVLIEQGSEIRDAMDGDRVPLEARENRILVASEAQSRGRANLRLMLDSGANSVVLLRAASQTLNLRKQEGGLELTSSGQVGLQVGRLDALTVGSQQFHNILVALPASETAERIGDGLLPTSLFQALYVNNREGFVVFNPRATHASGRSLYLLEHQSVLFSAPSALGKLGTFGNRISVILSTARVSDSGMACVYTLRVVSKLEFPSSACAVLSDSPTSPRSVA